MPPFAAHMTQSCSITLFICCQISLSASNCCQSFHFASLTTQFILSELLLPPDDLIWRHLHLAWLISDYLHSIIGDRSVYLAALDTRFGSNSRCCPFAYSSRCNTVGAWGPIWQRIFIDLTHFSALWQIVCTQLVRNNSYNEYLYSVINSFLGAVNLKYTIYLTNFLFLAINKHSKSNMLMNQNRYRFGWLQLSSSGRLWF